MADPTALATVAESDEIPRTKAKLDELTQAAALQYSLKNFAAAADHYADAVEIQAELNGEMAPENAELLFYYGRALYKVAVAKSDVLGAKGAQDDKKAKKAKKQAKADAGAGADAEIATGTGTSKTAPAQDATAPKPASAYFQLTGDENWDDSDDEEEEGDEDQEEEEDDFGNAYEVFELARVLYQKQLDSSTTTTTTTTTADTTTDKGKAPATLSPTARAIKEKIADCHGFLVEISLENERFHDAVADARASLALQQELHPFDHENVTESHYSLSLALEFASVSKLREDQVDASRQQHSTEFDKENNTDTDADAEGINWPLRHEAAEHTHHAIQSLQSRLHRETSSLSSLPAAQKKEKSAIIADKKLMLEELHGRLKELKADPNTTEFDNIDQSVVQGLLGSLLGSDEKTRRERIDEATKGARDVSQVVRKKVKPVPTATEPKAKEAKPKAEAEIAKGKAEAKAEAKETVEIKTEASGNVSGKRKLDLPDEEKDGKRSKTAELA